ncbi:hypothetical protein VTL71DRAFT_4279 [Oculimacula yallundae]|uniref:Uncharacterized protein n=1 Tax=Oculimacula yallundae TaxID=86028 RepID=A0ABR4C7N6_9HELO
MLNARELASKGGWQMEAETAAVSWIPDKGEAGKQLVKDQMEEEEEEEEESYSEDNRILGGSDGSGLMMEVVWSCLVLFWSGLGPALPLAQLGQETKSAAAAPVAIRLLGTKGLGTRDIACAIPIGLLVPGCQARIPRLGKSEFKKGGTWDQEFAFLSLLEDKTKPAYVRYVRFGSVRCSQVDASVKILKAGRYLTYLLTYCTYLTLQFDSRVGIDDSLFWPWIVFMKDHLPPTLTCEYFVVWSWSIMTDPGPGFGPWKGWNVNANATAPAPAPARKRKQLKAHLTSPHLTCTLVLRFRYLTPSLLPSPPSL